MSADQGPRRSSAVWRALCRAGRAFAYVHGEQARMWEAWTQANRAAAPEEGPLTWVLTLDGYRLGGRHLPAGSGTGAGGTP